MEADATAQRVREITCRLLEVDSAKVTPEARFIEDLGADSLGTIELTMAFEDEFDITICDDEATHNRTVGAVINLIKLKERADA